MPVQYIDLYHCLKCGELICREKGSEAPCCCGETMVRAVADIVRHYGERDEPGSALKGTSKRDALAGLLLKE